MMRNQVIIVFLVFLVFFFIYNKLTVITEGFAFGDLEFLKSFAPEVYKALKQKQEQATEEEQEKKSYNKWVGYLYKTAGKTEKNSAILNDFKKRVFQPNCKFRKDWANNKNIPTPADNERDATLAYKTYLKCLTKGSKPCIFNLANARYRFMEPGCQFLNPQDHKSYSRDFTVSF
jgi:hypothetical protein